MAKEGLLIGLMAPKGKGGKPESDDKPSGTDMTDEGADAMIDFLSAVDDKDPDAMWSAFQRAKYACDDADADVEEEA